MKNCKVYQEYKESLRPQRVIEIGKTSHYEDVELIIAESGVNYLSALKDGRIYLWGIEYHLDMVAPLIESMADNKEVSNVKLGCFVRDLNRIKCQTDLEQVDDEVFQAIITHGAYTAFKLFGTFAIKKGKNKMDDGELCDIFEKLGLDSDEMMESHDEESEEYIDHTFTREVVVTPKENKEKTLADILNYIKDNCDFQEKKEISLKFAENDLYFGYSYLE